MTGTEVLELLNLDVAGEHFSLDIQSVREIRVLSGLRALPDAPIGWLGVIDFRDAMVPIIDLRKVFSAQESGINAKTVVVIVQVHDEHMDNMVGVVADEVSDVLKVHPEDVTPPPQGFSGANDIVTGLFKHQGQIMVLLDSKKLVTTADLSTLKAQIAAVDRTGTQE